MLKQFNIQDWIITCLLTVWVGYVCLRVFCVEFTHDEAYSFIDMKMDGLRWSQYFAIANFHPLNSLGMWVCAKIFGVHDWALRLPNLCAAIIFAIYLGLLMRQTEWNHIAIPILLLILLNPFMTDFFGLARGYGIGLAGEMMSLYYCYLFFQATNSAQADTMRLGASIGSAIASLANSTFFPFQWMVCLCTDVSLLRRLTNLRKWSWKIWLALVIQLGSGIAVGALLLHQEARGALYFGGEQGFWVDTVRSLLSSSLYKTPYAEYILPYTFWTIIFLTSILLGTGLIRVIISRESLPSFGIALLLIGACGLICLFHLTKGTRFPMERGALWLWVLGWLAFGAITTSWQGWAKRLARFGFGLLSCVLTVHFFQTMNLSYAHQWRNDQYSKKIANWIHETADKQPNKLQVSCNWVIEPPIAFYLRYQLKSQRVEVNAWYYSWSNEADKKQMKSAKKDYYILYGKKDEAEFAETFPNSPYRTVQTFGDSIIVFH